MNPTRFAALALMATGLLTLGSGGLSAQAVESCETPVLLNGSFEEYTADLSRPIGSTGWTVGDWMNDWGTPQQFLFLDQDLPPQNLIGWETTNSGNIIELQRQVEGYEQDGSQSGGGYIDNFAVQPAEGNVWAELNANENAALYQDINLVAGTEYTWSLKHHGRVFGNVDEMGVFIGPNGGTLDPQTSIRQYLPTNADLFSGKPAYSDSFTNVSSIEGNLEDGWVMYRGVFIAPTTGSYTFEFSAISTGWGDAAVGNLLDDLEFDKTACVSSPSGETPPESTSEPSLAETSSPHSTLLPIVGALLVGTGFVLRIFQRRRS